MANHAAIIRAENAGNSVLRRGRNFIEFDLGNNQKRYVTTLEPLHLRNSEVEIDAAWVSDTGAWQWRLASTDFQAHARSIFNVGNLIEWRHESNEWVIVDPQSINWVNQDNSRQQIAIKQAVVGVADDATLSFPNAYGTGRHFSYTAHPQRLIKNITIDSLASLPAPTVTGTIHFEAEWTITNSTGVELFLDGIRWARTNNTRVRTANRIEFRDSATGTQVLWYADTPVATDANGETVNAEFEVHRQGTSYFIRVRVPRTWLLTATYPVQIDPTFTDGPSGDVTTSQDVMIRQAFPTANYDPPVGQSIWLFIGSEWFSTNYASRSLIKFALDQIPSGSTITSAVLSLWYTAHQSLNDRTLRVFRTKRAWVENQATWNIYSTGNNWSTAGGFHTDDCEQTDIGTFAATTGMATGEKQWTLTASAIEEMIAGGSWTNHGFMIKADTESNDEYQFRSSDNTTTAERPKLVVVYTEAGGEAFSGSVSDFVGLSDIVTTTLTSLADYYPIQDITVSGWTNELGNITNLYQSIDDVTPNASDYIQSANIPSGSTSVFKFESITDPQTTNNHILNYQIGKSDTLDRIDLNVELVQDYINESNQGTLITSWEHIDIPSGAFDTYSQSIPSGAVDGITDYSELYIRFIANKRNNFVSSISDNFNDNSLNTSLWHVGFHYHNVNWYDPNVTVVETNQRIEITTVNSSAEHYNGLHAEETFDLTSSSIFVECIQTTNASGMVSNFVLYYDVINFLFFSEENGILYVGHYLNNTPTFTTINPYNNTTHRWWRFRHETSDNTIRFDTSTDGIDWTQRRTSSPPFPITALDLQLAAGTYVARTSRVIIFDNLNIVP